MIIDIYNYFRNKRGYNKLIGDDYLIIEYKCPLDVEDYQFYTDSNLITYVIHGKKDWIYAGDIYPIEAGDALFIKKGVYTTRQYLDREYCVILFFMKDRFIRNFLIQNPELKLVAGSGKESQKQIFSIETTETFQSLVLSIFNYFKSGDEIPQSLVELKFRELLFNIVMNPMNREVIDHFSSLKQGSHTGLEEVMLKNFQYDLKIEDFARLSGRSLSTFKRDFHNKYNTTPGKWIIQKRLNLAKSLLLGTNLKVNEVCYESGFKNTSHFNKLFKKEFNFTPGDFKLKRSSF
ncbi:AraC family transcriptional regulator [Gramella lutea]|uniref:AraC family transcriptional regulator n=1 Tax=Christiangramia lutea TaxID=1607951 RepID=A0A9X1V2H4_9FLAO|nr:AraC family transcriptional regulator [Christiangramia lutea]MCH4823217.1 AraC family transcriptional regulator [Christiangramia lutea]